MKPRENKTKTTSIPTKPFVAETERLTSQASGHEELTRERPNRGALCIHELCFIPPLPLHPLDISVSIEMEAMSERPHAEQQIRENARVSWG
jgi:hypothetical protein